MGFSPAFDDIFTANTYIGNAREEGGLYFPWRGAPHPNELASQYRCVNLPKTDDNDRTHENDANAQSRHMVNASFWANASIGPIQVNCFGMGYSRRKNQTGGGGEGLRTYCFFKKPLELFWFFSVAMEVSGYIPRKFQGQNPRPLEISHEFFLVSLGYSTLFLINFWKFCMLFLEYPWKFYILNHLPLSCLNFFQNKKESQITGWLFP